MELSGTVFGYQSGIGNLAVGGDLQAIIAESFELSGGGGGGAFQVNDGGTIATFTARSIYSPTQP